MITWQPSHPRSADIAASRWRSTRITVASLTSISTFQRVMCSQPSSWWSRLSRARETGTKCKAWLVVCKFPPSPTMMLHIAYSNYKVTNIAQKRITVCCPMWEPTGKLLIAYTMYNSTRCYGIPYTYTVVSLCDRCFRVAVRGKGIILTSTTQNKLEIKILLTVKSSMTSIHSVWEHLNLLWKSTGPATKYFMRNTWPALAPPSTAAATRLKGFV